MMSTFFRLFVFVLLIVISSTITFVQSEFTPSTDSNWSSFTCFTATEVRQLFGDDNLFNMFEIGQGIDLLFDDWGLSSLAAAIIMKEILGYNVLLSSYSHSNTIDIIVNSSYIASALEIYPNYLNASEIYYYSVEHQLFMDQQLGVQSFNSWYIANTFIDHILKKTNSTDEIWLDFWKTYTLPQITDELLSTKQLQSFNITDNEQHLWNPSKCNEFNSSECNVLLIRDTEYDLQLNGEIINDYNLSFSMKYVNKQHRSLFLDEFVLYSLNEPSSLTNSNKFTRISLPSKYELSHITLIHKYIPQILDIISHFGYEFLQSLKMTNIDYNQIYASIINDMNSTGAHDDNIYYENTNDRLNAVCKWLKSEEKFQTAKWISWIPDTKQYTKINCGLYSDTELSKLLYLQQNENISYAINSSQIAKELYYEKLKLSHQSSITDLWTAIRVNNQCISNAKTYPNSLLAIQIVALILIFFILICFILLILSRDEVIIIAASYPLLLSFLCGAVIGCLVPIFGYPLIPFYITEILCIHTAIILMFGSLIAKSWRLHQIILNAAKGKITHITTKYILLRILFLCFIVWIYWTIIIGFKFGNVIQIYSISDGVKYGRVIMTNYRLFTLILLICEFCFILWGARIAWSLRAVNPQFNESKHIAVILYHTFFIILLIAIFGILLDINPHILRLLWMAVWLLMIAFTVSVLMLPKFRAIYNGVEYFDKGLVTRRTASEALKSTDWIPKELNNEQVQELVSVLRKLGFKVHRMSNHRSNHSSSNILKKRTIRQQYHSASVADKYEYHNHNRKEKKKKKNDHLRAQSALPSLTQLNIKSNGSNDTVILHDENEDDDSDEFDDHNPAKVSSLSVHKKNAATVLGLPPPSAWDYDDEYSDEDTDNIQQSNEGAQHNNYTETHEIIDTNVQLNMVARPPPLPAHIKRQFQKKKHARKIHHQRAQTSPVASPHSEISMVSSIEPVSPAQANLNVPSKQPKINENRSGSSRVSDIIAKFNYINVPIAANVTDEEYID